MEPDSKFRELFEKAQLEIPDRNFDDNVMRKIVFSHNIQQQRKTNILLSWIFLLISIVTLPNILIFILKNSEYSVLQLFKINPENFSSVFIPTLALATAIVILIQIDNLLRLSFQVK